MTLLPSWRACLCVSVLEGVQGRDRLVCSGPAGTGNLKQDPDSLLCKSTRPSWWQRYSEPSLNYSLPSYLKTWNSFFLNISASVITVLCLRGAAWDYHLAALGSEVCRSFRCASPVVELVGPVKTTSSFCISFFHWATDSCSVGASCRKRSQHLGSSHENTSRSIFAWNNSQLTVNQFFLCEILLNCPLVWLLCILLTCSLTIVQTDNSGHLVTFQLYSG